MFDGAAAVVKSDLAARTLGSGRHLDAYWPMANHSQIRGPNTEPPLGVRVCARYFFPSLEGSCPVYPATTGGHARRGDGGDRGEGGGEMVSERLQDCILWDQGW